MKIAYPSGVSIENTYDLTGFLVGVHDAATKRSYWSAKTFDALGRELEETMGNGVSTVREFRASDQRPTAIRTSGPGSKNILDLALDYDRLGNLRSRSETVDTRVETFDYDQINRLSVQVDSGGQRSEYRYDPAGRPTYKSAIGDYHYDTNPTVDPTYGNPFHGVHSTNYGKYEQRYRYDLNGNMVSMPVGHLDYTADNRVKLIYFDKDRWSRFDYTPGGERFRQVEINGETQEETIYSGLYERVTDTAAEDAGGLPPPRNKERFKFVRSRSYLVNSGGVFAFIETQETFSNAKIGKAPEPGDDKWYGKLATTETWYLHADQLGSILRITDQDGQLRKTFWYDPWGARHERGVGGPGSGESQTLAESWKRGFTGQEALDPFQLVHMNGRVYNPVLGVFLSVDPLNELADPQGGASYSYARNNPLRYVDTNGMFFTDHFFHEIGKAAEGAWNGVTHFGSEVGKWVSDNYKVIIVVAVVIVVTYCTLGTATPATITLGDAILAGAASGAAGSATATALNGGTLDQVLESAFKGAVIGAATGAAFYGVGQYFGELEPDKALTASEKVESVAAHGVVGGTKEAVEGGDFWKGFISTAATKASSVYGPEFHNTAANIARAAAVGGTVAALDGGKFANGAITGAFSYAFNDLLHEYGNRDQALGFHHRLVIINDAGERIDGFSFGEDNDSWPLHVMSGDDAPTLKGKGDGSIFEDDEGSGGSPIERFKTTPDEDMAIKAYMVEHYTNDYRGKYNLWSNSCINFCNKQYDYIKSQIEKSRREMHSPVFSH